MAFAAAVPHFSQQKGQDCIHSYLPIFQMASHFVLALCNNCGIITSGNYNYLLLSNRQAMCKEHTAFI